MCDRRFAVLQFCGSDVFWVASVPAHLHRGLCVRVLI